MYILNTKHTVETEQQHHSRRCTKRKQETRQKIYIYMVNFGRIIWMMMVCLCVCAWNKVSLTSKIIVWTVDWRRLCGYFICKPFELLIVWSTTQIQRIHKIYIILMRLNVSIGSVCRIEGICRIHRVWWMFDSHSRDQLQRINLIK